MGGVEGFGIKHTPSPAEIARECAKIREGWSAKEHKRRLGLVDRPIEVYQHTERLSHRVERREMNDG